MQKIIDSIKDAHEQVDTAITEAEKTYAQAKKAGAKISDLVKLDPGQLRAARGCLLTAMQHATNFAAQSQSQPSEQPA